ncbi:HAD family hydrolase, partial [Klebsiella pneumoniae]|nr:HAD family hydrolase [Klebsiella pneumoniae]
VINAIVTNKPLDALEKILNIKKWIELFDSWISPDSLYSESKVYMSKEEMISLMISKYNISPFDCVYIGDSYSDVESSRENCVDC